MKRALAIILLLGVALALGACGSSSGEAARAVATQASVDLDLSVLSGTVVYSQVYDMTQRPEAYLGQTVKLRGNFSYFQDPDTHNEYFAAVIADATACCAQGIEFLWAGDHAFPDDYPPLDTEITVVGTFGTYEENGYTYLRLSDAEVTWERV